MWNFNWDALLEFYILSDDYLIDYIPVVINTVYDIRIINPKYNVFLDYINSLKY